MRKNWQITYVSPKSGDVVELPTLDDEAKSHELMKQLTADFPAASWTLYELELEEVTQVKRTTVSESYAVVKKVGEPEKLEEPEPEKKEEKKIVKKG